MNLRPYAQAAFLAALAAGIPAAVGAKAPARQAAAPIALAPPAVMQLEVGASQTLGLRGAIDKVTVDTPDVISARAASAREVVITGLKPGHASIAIGSGAQRADYDVTVVESGAAKAEELRRRMAAYPGLSNLQVEMRGDKIALSGRLSSLEDHAKAVSLAQGLVDDKNLSDLTQVEGERMVAVDIHFYAISDTTLNALGLNFTNLGSGIQSALLGPSTASGFSFGPANPLTVTTPMQSAFTLFLGNQKSGMAGALSALSEVGLSQTLAQPTLLVRSGEQADFLAGGEIPIPVPQGGAAAGTITITYKPYGVRLSVAPVVLNGNRIVLKLAPEVSELDQVNKLSIQGFSVPAILRRSANTTVELADGESYVIAGLTYAESNVTVDRIPGLGNLPVIGALFRRAQSTGQKQQLIIVATPHLVRPMSGATVASSMPTSLEIPKFDHLLDRDGVQAPASDVGLKR